MRVTKLWQGRGGVTKQLYGETIAIRGDRAALRGDKHFTEIQFCTIEIQNREQR